MLPPHSATFTVSPIERVSRARFAVRVRRAAHSQNAHDRAHARAHHERNAARPFNKQRKNQRNQNDDDRNRLVFRFQKSRRAAANDLRHFDHLMRALAHFPDPEVVVEYVDNCQKHHAQNHKPSRHECPSFNPLYPRKSARNLRGEKKFRRASSSLNELKPSNSPSLALFFIRD